MTDPIKQGEEVVVPPVATPAPATDPAAVTPPAEAPTDPLKKELENVKKGNGKSELEKATFSLKKNAERVVELGGDPNTVLGMTSNNPSELEDEDDQPVTHGQLKKFLGDKGKETALELAEAIQDETERELVKHYLQNRIVPSGDAQQDLKDARRAVNSIRNEQIIETVVKKTEPLSQPSSSSTPANPVKKEEQFTEEELIFMRPPYNLTKEEVLKARQG